MFECFVGRELWGCEDVGDSPFIDLKISKYTTRGIGAGMIVGGDLQRKLFQVEETQERWPRSSNISL